MCTILAVDSLWGLTVGLPCLPGALPACGVTPLLCPLPPPPACLGMLPACLGRCMPVGSPPSSDLCCLHLPAWGSALHSAALYLIVPHLFSCLWVSCYNVRLGPAWVSVILRTASLPPYSTVPCGVTGMALELLQMPLLFPCQP